MAETFCASPDVFAVFADRFIHNNITTFLGNVSKGLTGPSNVSKSITSSPDVWLSIIRLTIVAVLAVLLVVSRFLLQFHLLQIDGAHQLSLHRVTHPEIRRLPFSRLRFNRLQKHEPEHLWAELQLHAAPLILIRLLVNWVFISSFILKSYLWQCCRLLQTLTHG